MATAHPHPSSQTAGSAAHPARHTSQREHDLRPFTHAHAFGDPGMAQRERALWWVTVITLVTMVLELAAGWWSGSLALLADGWHMGTHALALGGAVLAYRLSRRAQNREGYAFGGWKIEVLAAYTSGLALLAVAIGLVVDGVQRLLAPQPIAYTEAMMVAVVGLVVNVASVWLLGHGTGGSAGHAHGHGGHDHAHGTRGEAQIHDERQYASAAHGHARAHATDEPGDGERLASAHAGQAHHGPHAHHGQGRGRDHDHDHAHTHHHDHNFSAAYWHVIADALTSVLAITALAGGLWFGWSWLDAAVALLGAALIGQWSWRMLKSTSRALVDATQEPELSARVRAAIEVDGDARVADLHVWQVGSRAWTAAVSVVADRPLGPADYRARLRDIEHLQHLTIEVNRCEGGDCLGAQVDPAGRTATVGAP